jgi:MATE family multidrug resistance protein
MIPLGTGVTCASLVGNALGAGERSLAASIAKLTIGIIVCIELVIGTSLFVGGSVYVDLFSKDPEVIHVINRAIPFLALFTMVDGLQGVCSGVLRGAGKQTIGAVANIIAFYAIGLPMAWTLCFKTGLGVNGLMMGIACGTIFQATVLLTLIFGFEKYMFSGTILREVKTESEPMMKSGSKDMKGDFQRLPELDDEESQHGILLNQLSLTTQPA